MLRGLLDDEVAKMRTHSHVALDDLQPEISTCGLDTAPSTKSESLPDIQVSHHKRVVPSDEEDATTMCPTGASCSPSHHHQDANATWQAPTLGAIVLYTCGRSILVNGGRLACSPSNICSELCACLRGDAVADSAGRAVMLSKSLVWPTSVRRHTKSSCAQHMNAKSSYALHFNRKKKENFSGRKNMDRKKKKKLQENIKTIWRREREERITKSQTRITLSLPPLRSKLLQAWSAMMLPRCPRSTLHEIQPLLLKGMTWQTPNPELKARNAQAYLTSSKDPCRHTRTCSTTNQARKQS